MKHTVTDLNDPSEPAAFTNTAIEHYTFDSYFVNLSIDSSLNENVDGFQKSINTHLSHLLEKLPIMYIMSIQILD